MSQQPSPLSGPAPPFGEPFGGTLLLAIDEFVECLAVFVDVVKVLFSEPLFAAMAVACVAMRLTNHSSEAQSILREFLPRRRIVAECYHNGQFLILDVLVCRSSGDHFGIFTNLLDAAACFAITPVAQLDMFQNHACRTKAVEAPCSALECPKCLFVRLEGFALGRNQRK